MLSEDEQQFFSAMFDCLESCLLRVLVQGSLLEVSNFPDWQNRVERLASRHAPRLHQVLQPLRDGFLARTDETIRETNWDQIVRKLIESVGEIDASDE